MIELSKGSTNDEVIVTLSEKTTLANPHYLFVFKHIETNQLVSFVIGPDLSEFKDRYNKFEINTSESFLDKPEGDWLYSAFEQESSSNIDPEHAHAEVESGRMRLISDESFSFKSYHTESTFVAYNG